MRLHAGDECYKQIYGKVGYSRKHNSKHGAKKNAHPGSPNESQDAPPLPKFYLYFGGLILDCF